MSFHELDIVVLERDLPEHGLRRGDTGTVVDVLDGRAVTVEFVRASGMTQALVDVGPADVRPTTDDDMPAVRLR
jgi:hypothetical protein